MPTGYTHDIKDGISFEQFVLNCARAFGACITLRDESGGGEKIPEAFEPSDYHQKALGIARNTLAELEDLTFAECERRAAADYDEAEQSRITRLQENKQQLAAYAAMLDKVRLWSPPSSEHVGLHEFMQSQITESIKFDDRINCYEKPTVRLSGIDWHDEKKARAIKDIAYHKAEHTKEVERTNQRNEWVRLLRESLEPIV